MSAMGMKTAGLTSLALLAAFHPGNAGASGDPVFGFWMVENQRAIVEIMPCGAQACGSIVWLKEPLDDDGQPKIDDRNADEKLRGQSLCGIELIRKFRNSGSGTWSSGSIYSPRDGGTYSASMKLRGDDALELRGYLLLPLFGETQIWTRETDDRGGC